jgi:heme A synthase
VAVRARIRLQVQAEAEEGRMHSEKLVEQLELYSNGIVGFIVAQSLVFSFTFGVQPVFGCVVAREKLLAYALVAHFVLGTLLAVGAIQFLSRSMQRLAADNHALLRKLFAAKSAVVVIFAVIPVFVLVTYGVLREPGTGRCAEVDTSSPARLQ